MKKRLVTVLVIILILNLIMPNIFVIAYFDTIDSSIDAETGLEVVNKMDPNIFNDLYESGEAIQNPASGEAGGSDYTVNSQKVPVTITSNASTGLMNVLAMMVLSMPAIISRVLNVITNSATDSLKIERFTIQDTVFREIELFDINFFNIGQGNTIGQTLKEQIGIWYGNIRNLAIAISLCVLIYIGIRMAISTLATDKVKYKMLLTKWLKGFILIFIMHYIILFIINIAEAVIDIFPKPDTNVEISIMEDVEKNINSTNGWSLLLDCIVYCGIIYYQCKFFYIYIKRLIMTGFLVIIAPIVFIYYGLGQDKIYKKWFQEIIVNIVIQPLHAAIYLVFIVSAGEIAKAAPLLAILFLGALSRAEKIVKNIFSMRRLATINSIGSYQFKKKK